VIRGLVTILSSLEAHEDSDITVFIYNYIFKPATMEFSISSVDLTEDMISQVFEVTRHALERFVIDKDVAKYIKLEFDRKFY